MALVYSALGKPFHVPASKGERVAREELREQGGTPEDLQKTPGAVANALSSVFGKKDTGTRLPVFPNTETPANPNSPEEQGDLQPGTGGPDTRPPLV